jgi:NAD(P)H-dependent flavin oxidoreductase YrpB (nitropropane dioxygenase family)
MKTPLCDRLGIDLPIILAAMGGAGCPALAAAVANAGGLGMLALARAPLEDVRAAIRATRALTARPFGVNLVLEWPQEERLAVCLEEGVSIISLFWGDPAPLVPRAHAAGATVFHTVASAGDARQAIAAGVDVLVAQGWEAGGHVRGQVATLPLTAAVLSVAGSTPVVAAGGIADGRSLAAVLTLGAQAGWIGTRFLASEEAAIHPRYRERLFAAAETDTVYSALYDGGWPNAPTRTLRNATYDAWVAAGRPPPGRRPGEGEVLARAGLRELRRYDSATPTTAAEGDIDDLSLWAGQGVVMVTKPQSAADIVSELAAEARAALRRASTLLA